MTEQPINHRTITLETGLFSLALLLALLLRLINLGSQPLNELEAGWALQALQEMQPGAAQPATLGPQPAYIFLTGAIFAMFGASDLAARLWPALAGSALVLLPVLLRRRLGAKAALVMAFGLALDPGLVVISRQAGGPMLALAFGLLALGFWDARKPLWAGILGGLALLSGPAIIFGIVVWGVVQAGLALARRRMPQAAETDVVETNHRVAIYPALPQAETADPEISNPEIADDEDDPAPFPPAQSGTVAASSSPDLRTALLAGLATFVLVGSALLQHPAGLAAAIYALPSFLLDWVKPATVTPGQMLAVLLVYQPFGLIFAGVALARWVEARLLDGSTRREPAITLPLWGYFLVALLLALLFPARQPAYLAFALVPLWGAAAIGLANYLPGRRPNVIAGLQTAIILILAALLWVWLSSSEVLVPSNSELWWALRPAIVLGILALAALTTALVALGWQWEYGRDGLVWGLAAAFLIYSTAALWGAAYLRPNQPQELWGAASGPGQARLLMRTINELSLWERGMAQEIEVISLVDEPTLRWALRDYPQARFLNSLPADERPGVVITARESELPALSASYRGQDFVWWVRPAWSGALPPNPILWLAYRQAPTMNEYVILWARTDLFPGSEAQTQP